MEQTKQLQDSFMPEKFRVLSGSALKVLAMVIMLIDHTAAFLLVKSAAATRTLFVLGGTDISIYRIMRDVGRAAFPIFCFLLVEGFVHTHNRFKYGRNLLIFACISEIPWDLVHNLICLPRMCFLHCFWVIWLFVQLIIIKTTS